LHPNHVIGLFFKTNEYITDFILILYILRNGFIIQHFTQELSQNQQ